MKKNLLMLSFCGLSIIASAQNRSLAPVKGLWANKSVVSSRAATLNDNNVPFVKPNPTTAAVHKGSGGSYSVNCTGTEAVIGNTDYDLQTNSSSYPRLIKNSDGTMSAGWTYYPDGANTTDRGTGYNYFDGSNWGPAPTARIEGPTHRTGFINMVVTGSGQEASFGHSSTDSVVLYTHRPIKGMGAWSSDNTSLRTNGYGNTDTWARVVAGGSDNQSIHCIVNTNDQGTAGGNIIYSRSTDDGATWSVLRSVISGMSATDYPYFLGGDAYALATKGDVVAIVLGDISTDVALFKSTDNGTTWTKTQVTHSFDNFIPPGSYNPDGNISDINADGVADTVDVTGGDLNVVIDNNGICHLFWGTMRMLDDDATVGTATFNVFLATNGIGYWNEGMAAPIIAARAEDWNGNGTLDLATYNGSTTELGWGRYGNMGLAAVPSAAIDGNGNIFMAFQAVNELSDTSFYNKTHYQIYLTASTDNGLTWSLPCNVNTAGGNSDSLLFEGVYPSMAKDANGTVFIEYERDYLPGLFWGATAGSVDATLNDPAGNVNDIVVIGIPTPQLLGINELSSNPNSFTVTQNSPNPSIGSTYISINFATTSDVKVEVSTLTGQVIFSNEQSKMLPGTHTLNINTSGYSPGVYLYTVTVDGQKVTKKMIVQ